MIVTVIIAVAAAMLSAAAVLTLFRLARGPSTLDRVVAGDVVIAILICGLALEAALNRHVTTLPVILVLALLGFAGSLSVARFAADRDQAISWRDPDGGNEGRGWEDQR